MKLQELKKNRFVKHLIKDVSNNADWLQFFLMFSRFEYALKRSGYIKPRYPRQNYSRNVEADWNRFSVAIEQDFRNNVSRELKNSTNYLAENPPYRQIRNNNGELEWQQPSYTTNDLQSMIRIIKTVRNNLFHGGKYPTMPVRDPSGDTELIRHSTILLKHLICTSNEVERHYFEELN